MNKEYDHTEQSRRVNLECAELLKAADFVEECPAFYDRTTETYQEGVVSRNWNEGNTFYSAPLIDIVEDKCKEWGYSRHYRSDTVRVYHNDRLGIRTQPIGTYKLNPQSETLSRKDSLAFIKAACEHKIKNQK